MAKIKISELANELGCEGKEIVSFLHDKGVEAAKRVTSSIEDTEAEIARKHFGNNGEHPVKKETEAKAINKGSQQPAETKKVAENKSETKTAPAQNGQSAAPKKKKNIIFVTNQNNSKSGSFNNQNHSGSSASHNRPQGQQQRNGNNNQPRRSNTFNAAPTHRIIKPLTAPSQLESYDVKVTRSETPVKKVEAEQPKQTPVVEQAAASKPVSNTPAAETKPVSQGQDSRPNNNRERNYSNNNQNSYNNQSRPSYNNDRGGRSNGDYRGQRQGGGYNNNRNSEGGSVNRYNGQSRDNNRGSYQGQGRPAGGYQGGQRQGGGMNGRPSFGGQQRSFGGDRGGNGYQGGQRQGGFRNGNGQGRPGASSFAPAPEMNEKHAEGKRRQERDKHNNNKKDMAFEDEEMMPRSKRVGRFIKPEVKKVEEPEEQIKVIQIPEKLTIKELAEKMKMQPSAIIKKLFLAGQIVTVNSEVTYEEAENIAIDYEIMCEKEVQVDVIEELLKEDEDDEATLVSRPPVVCVMGHVDHGKTSLLDAIRETSVTEKEAGGITQRIGAYQVMANDRKITFLDTPGHEAFTAMRMRGANSTDIAVLVVAADDGVMPQTIEAINHAKAANVEIIVAVNKMDKPNANIDRVKQEMTEYGLIATDWGGSTEFVPVSAKTGEGIDTLLETVILTADILELKANPDRQARGLVLEAKLDKGRGPVANVLIQKGTLHVGDFISAGAASGKVRAMSDDKGRKLKEALPSQPVEILGLSDVPNAGEVLIGHESDKEAKQFAGTYLQQHKKDLIEETKAKMSLDDLYSKIEEGKLKELEIILKADVQGSVEALKQSLMKLSNEEVVVKIIHSGVGAINESDVSLASASNAIIIGFDVRPDAMAKSIAEHEGVEIKLYKVIYQAIDDVEAALKGMLAPIYEEKVTGHAEIRQIFKASKVGNIAGSVVTDGVITKDSKVRVTRDGEQVFEGELASLKRFKDDVKEVKDGYECGLVFADYDEIQVGDLVEAYTMVEVPRT